MRYKIEDIIKYSEAKKITLTKQQLVIVNIMIEANTSLTLHEILLKNQKIKPNANRMTIYRAMDKLTKCRLIHKLQSINSYKLCEHIGCNYNPVCQIIICKKCYKYIEIYDKKLVFDIKSNLKLYGFNINNEIEIQSICNTCLNRT